MARAPGPTTSVAGGPARRSGPGPAPSGAGDQQGELWRRLSGRNTRPGQAVIARPTLTGYQEHLQAPDIEELDHYDAHHE